MTCGKAKSLNCEKEHHLHVSNPDYQQGDMCMLRYAGVENKQEVGIARGTPKGMLLNLIQSRDSAMPPSGVGRATLAKTPALATPRNSF